MPELVNDEHAENNCREAQKRKGEPEAIWDTALHLVLMSFLLY